MKPVESKAKTFERDSIASHGYHGSNPDSVDVVFRKAGFFKVFKNSNPKVFDFLMNLEKFNVAVCIEDGVLTDIQYTE